MDVFLAEQILYRQVVLHPPPSGASYGCFLFSPMAFLKSMTCNCVMQAIHNFPHPGTNASLLA
eukprot:4004936-Prorocentrum_lima.AAC.1